MSKIYLYELRRTVRGKFFWGLLAVCLFFGWNILQTTVIRGVAHTAPFSPWTFGAYLARLMPLLGVALLFFQWNQCNEKARRFWSLTDASPAEPGQYLLVKCAAAATAWLLLALGVTALGIGFLLALFHDSVPMGMLLLTAAAALLPPLVFLTGTGLLAGHIRSSLLFVWMAFALGVGFIPLPGNLDLYGYSFFTEYPLTLQQTDPAFSMPAGMLAARVVFLLVGMGFLFLAVWRQRRQKGKG